jgi:riboflavin biosynthesis pyrimidine reductase
MTPEMTPILPLYRRDGLAQFDLPAELAALYGGDFGLARPRVYANFVASLDGVVALPGAGESGAVVSGGSEADRFVMGLLRAAADAVLIGAGTFRKAAGDLWHAEAVFPAAAAPFAELRRRLGLRPQPPLVVVTASGAIDVAQPALRDAVIVTSPAGEARLRGALPDGARVRVLARQPVDDRRPGDRRPADGPDAMGHALIDLLRGEGFQTILSEGGPTLFGELLGQGLVDEVFVTTSPRLFGRWPDDQRKSLVAGRDLGGRALELASVHRHESHLFLRYTL